MRPVRLEFRGLRSYRAATTIDFSDLDLFAIIGDTGAGKSTVIEALSLALYGRKTWTGGSNLEELIADGENTMAIELVFVAEGNEWTVTRSRHRNSSPPINKLECRATAEKVDGNRAVNDRIEQLLGLDHSQFVRAVVLPQGRFDELLQATRTDRNKILRSIFGLDDLRRVRDDATRRRDSWRPILTEAQARRDVLPPDPSAALAAATVAVGQARQHLASLAEAIDAADVQQRRSDDLAEQIRRLERARADFSPDPAVLDPLDELAGRGSALVAERDRLTAVQTDAEARRDRAHAEQVALLRGFDDHQQAFGAAARLRSVAANLHELDADAAEAAATVEHLAAEAPSDDEPAAIGAAVDSAAAERAAAQLDADAAGAAVERASVVWRTLVDAAEQVDQGRSALEAAQDAADRARTEAAVAGAGIGAAESALEAARAAHRAAQRANAAVVAARGVRPGDACPVCAQEVPPGFVEPEADDLEAAGAQVQVAEERMAEARRVATTAETTAAHRTESLAAARASFDRALVTVGERRAAAVGLALDPDEPDEDSALAELRRVADAAGAALDQAIVVAGRAEQARVTAAAERAAAVAAHQREMATARDRVTQIETRRRAQRDQVRDLPPAWAAGEAIPAGELERIADSIQSMLGELETLVGAASAADAEATRARQRFTELRAEAVENVNTPVADIVRVINAQLASARAVVELVDDDPGDRALPAPIETPVLLDQLPEVIPSARAIMAALGPLDDESRSVLATLEADRIDAARHLAAVLETAGVADIAALHAQAGGVRAEAARLDADITVLGSQVEAARRLDAMLDIGRPYLANLDLLIQSLRDQHFVDHLVSAREVELLGEATRRLKAISDGRYGFVPDFGVVRIASGEVRSPDTLSGGERFQAALALALALVEIASRGAGKLDAVFVDEGFGSLDGAALDVALDTLGSVAGGGKLVALISHLHPVAEYVDTVFNVVKDDLFGSTITKLDAEAREALLDDDIRSGLTR